MTPYNKDGLSATLDDGAVTLYLEDVPVIEMTRQEFNELANAVMSAKEE